MRKEQLKIELTETYAKLVALRTEHFLMQVKHKDEIKEMDNEIASIRASHVLSMDDFTEENSVLREEILQLQQRVALNSIAEPLMNNPFILEENKRLNKDVIRYEEILGLKNQTIKALSEDLNGWKKHANNVNLQLKERAHQISMLEIIARKTGNCAILDSRTYRTPHRMGFAMDMVRIQNTTDEAAEISKIKNKVATLTLSTAYLSAFVVTFVLAVSVYITYNL